MNIAIFGFFHPEMGGGRQQNQSLINTVHVDVISYNIHFSFYFMYFIYLICLDGDKIIFTLTTGTKMSYLLFSRKPICDPPGAGSSRTFITIKCNKISF